MQTEPPHPAIRILTSRVPPESDGMKICSYLAQRFRYCSRDGWKEFMDQERITCNGQTVGPEMAVRSGDHIRFTPPEDIEPPVHQSYRILYEDENLLAVSKPPLLPIHPSGRFFAHTLWYLLQQQFGKIHIITRLDRETSGVVIVARNPGEAKRLQQCQNEGSIRKLYLALVHGDFPSGEQQAEGWLSRDPESRIRKKRRFTTCRPDDPAAEYCNTVLSGADMTSDSAPPDGDVSTVIPPQCSLVKARLITGRTHQIRATLCSLGYPVVGDKIYGLNEEFFLRFIDDTLSKNDRSKLQLPHQALHCTQVDLPAPDGSVLTFHDTRPW